MPRYDYRCNECGAEEERFLTLAEHDAPQACECGHVLRTVIAPIRTIGPMPSKPVTLGGAGVEVRSNEEMRRYTAENPTARVLDKGDSWMRNHRDQARERAEGVAQRQGFRDWGQRQEVLKAEKKRKKVLDG